MSLVQTTVTQAKPGRRHDAIAIGIEASKLLERHGADDNRLLVAQMAGEQTGTYAWKYENAVLTFSKVADKCEDRVRSLIKLAWKAQK